MTETTSVLTDVEYGFVHRMLQMGADERKIAELLAKVLAANRVLRSEATKDERAIEQKNSGRTNPEDKTVHTSSLGAALPVPSTSSLPSIGLDLNSPTHKQEPNKDSLTASAGGRASTPGLSGTELEQAIKSHPRYPHVQEALCSSICDWCTDPKVWGIIEPEEGWVYFCRHPKTVDHALALLLRRPHSAMRNYCKACATSAYERRTGRQQ